MLQITTLVVGDLGANCYIVHGGEGSECAVVDCGGDAAEVAAAIRSLKLTPRYLVSTHCHVDHIAGNSELMGEFPDMELCGHPFEFEWYPKPTLNLSYFLGSAVTSPVPTRQLDEGDSIDLAGEKLAILHVPGHSPGSIALCFESDRGAVVIDGDTLFAGGIGRTDFHGGDTAELMQSIAGKILALPDETILLSGHGPETTVGDEKRTNPFLDGAI